MNNNIHRRNAILRRNAVIVAAIAFNVVQEESTRSQRRKHWVNPYLRQRAERGRYAKDNPEVFMENFHMSLTIFNKLLGLLEIHLLPKRDTRSDAIPPKAKLAIVLQYLASGDIQRHLGSVYRVSKQRIGVIIDNVCSALCVMLKNEVPRWSKVNMQSYADKYFEKWNFPNCVGAIDGKHVAIKAPHNCGSAFYNYKGFNSIVMAVCDADYKFTFLEIGAYGSEGDMHVFSHSDFGKAVLADCLEFPEDKPINGVPIPYFLIGDDAFPLCKRIMKPYKGRSLSEEELKFNYRLSRARRCIENAFGILSAKWMAVQRTLLCHPERAQKIVTACCLLQNYMLREDPKEYSNRIDAEVVVVSTPVNRGQAFRGRHLDYPKYMRNTLKDFVNSEAAKLPWE
ncbi:putative nuclease HARBI1 isoform X2 [Drosophila takahashii]|uniref:putative nuclease HARBI1 isoform X2 n=1 Tax=Drosophila takahashii TaxID=29030 RepID=UPI003898E961